MGFKKPALTKEFQVYSALDPCVEATDQEKYAQTLDTQFLKINDGATVFTITPITTTQKIASYPGSSRQSIKVAYESCEYLVRAGLKKASNFLIGEKPIELISAEDGLLTKETIDQLQDENLVFELASHIRQISHLPPFSQE